jgi:hypothetical protein
MAGNNESVAGGMAAKAKISAKTQSSAYHGAGSGAVGSLAENQLMASKHGGVAKSKRSEISESNIIMKVKKMRKQ